MTPTSGPPLGVIFIGALGVLAVADTRVAPVAVAFLTAAVIYNALPLLQKAQGVTPAGAQNRARQAARPGGTTGGFAGGGASGSF